MFYHAFREITWMAIWYFSIWGIVSLLHNAKIIC